MITRRQFSAGALAMLAPRKFTHALGAELYTVRAILPTAAEPTMKSIAAIGYREVETDLPTLTTIAPMLKDLGLKAVACHVAMTVMNESSKWEQAIRDVRKFGVEYMVMPYVRPEDRGDLDSYKALADKMNRAGAQCRAAGVKFCYHNHCFEFRGELGKRPIDILLERLDRKDVGLELDVFWVSVGGADPVEMLKQNGGRIPLVHLKDKAKDTPVQYEEAKVSRQAFKEVGAGVLDFPAILKAAAAAGARHYFVEQDQTPGDPVASLKQSYEYLRSL